MIHDNNAYIRSLDRAARRRHAQYRSMIATILGPYGWPFRGLVLLAHDNSQGRLDPSATRRTEANTPW